MEQPTHRPPIHQNRRPPRRQRRHQTRTLTWTRPAGGRAEGLLGVSYSPTGKRLWTRDDAGNEDRHYGVPRTYLRELADHRPNGDDWRAAEAEINNYEPYDVELADVPVHFMRSPGVGPNPTPLIPTHGWPWTF
ncbi:epoxide hydrolase N-terminal domain-containing protein [Nocardia carnea]|uniref:epoxide hydrolase N-terminal domain-containing protein n=1 Tax=Nocardia carnea TaxID=37328 RepID=UPI00245799C0|nr:epoxide hydrolase N-terminal domain-containing protein [Nocardia carnea]